MILKKSQYFMYFRFYNPKDLEKHLEQLGNEGWHPERMNFASFVKVDFVKGDPINYRYIVDYQFNPSKDYINTYEISGWSLVGKASDMYIWRKKYTDFIPEAFSNVQNIYERNKKLQLMYLMFCIICFLCAIISTYFYIHHIKTLVIWNHIGLWFEMIVFWILTVCLIERISRLSRK